MNRNHFSETTQLRPASPSPACARLLLSLVLLCSAVPALAARQSGGGNNPPAPAAQEKQAAPADAASVEKAEGILRRALEAAGGSAFLGVQSVVGRGYFSPFDKGVSGPPVAFTDYFVFPDRERTEFKGQGRRSVQTNTGTTGWTYNNESNKILDITPDQVKDFQIAVRTGLDNVLRGWWRKEGARLSYVGRREAGLARRNEVVRLTYPDGFAVEFEFGAKDGLLSKVRYKRTNSEGEETEEEDRFARHVEAGGVTLPYIIDHYRAGSQTIRINYDTYEFNRPIPDSLFARPADIKALNKSFK